MSPTIDATSYVSPNYSDRPGGVAPDMLVLHDGEGSKQSDLDRLRNNRVPMERRVSSHYYVDREGRIYELVDPSREAWHAGASYWMGRHNLNPYSIGVETEHKAGQNWPDIQRRQIGVLFSYLIGRFHIPQQYVVCHRWIAPGRKFDPSDWPDEQLKPWIASLYTPTAPTPDNPRPYRLRVPQAVFTAPDPASALAAGPTIYLDGMVVQIGQLRDGWAWIKTGPGRLEGPGFVPSGTLEPV